MEKKMNKIFSVLLLVTFSFSVISCSSEDSSGATSQLGQVLDQPNSTDDRNSTDLPDLTLDNCYLIDNSTIDNSTIDKSSIKNNSNIKDSTVRNGNWTILGLVWYWWKTEYDYDSWCLHCNCSHRFSYYSDTILLKQ